ncbi:hypothetical protein OQA88_10366 [Cercophora sp. LCS_1]
MPALPFVYLTLDLDAFTLAALEQERFSTEGRITKLYLRSDVELLKQEYAVVRGMGQGAVDEWLKGLDGRFEEARNEAAKWEKWEDSGGTIQMIRHLYPGFQDSRTVIQPNVPTKLLQSAPPVASTQEKTTLPSIPPPPSLPARHERTAEEAAELKAARRAEIERRALLLDPPLTRSILQHMSAYQAAIQIVASLDDDAWERLKPRLLVQRAEAEQQEKENQLDTKVVEPPAAHRLEETLATTKEARDLIDKDWEVTQAPLRAKIVQYVDEIINDGWDRGKRVSSDNCSKFAVDALNYVRNRFYAQVAKDAAARRAAGLKPIIDPPAGPFTQKLTLENMKWIFDSKVKPITEPFRKELFFCNGNGNGCDTNAKEYGFEGVIQHYAAKHTNALSLGSIVVYWRAEWPEQPPFTHKRPAHFGSASVPPPAGYNYQHAPQPAPPPVYFGTGPYIEPPFQPPVGPQPFPPPAAFAAFPPTSYAQQPSYAPQAAPYQPYQVPSGPYPSVISEPRPLYGTPRGQDFTHGFGAYPPAHPPPGSFPPAIPPTYHGDYQAKLEDVARNAREIWNALNNVKDLPGSARVLTTIYHVAKRYRSKFHEAPSLAMFIDGLSNNKDMRPVRNVNQLVCKACNLGLGNAAVVEPDRESYSLPQLTNHFQSKHVKPMELQGATPLDWVVDMVFFADQASLCQVRSFGGSYQKSLLTEVFPEELSPQSGRSNHSSARGSTGTPQGPDQVGRRPPGQPTFPHATGDQRFAQTYNEPAQDVKPSIGRNIKHELSDDGNAHRMTLLQPSPVEDHTGQSYTSAGHQPRGEHDGQHPRKGHGKNRRGKHHSAIETARDSFEEGARRDAAEARRETENIKAMWVTERAETSRAFTERAGARNTAQDLPLPRQASALRDARPLSSEQRVSRPAGANEEADIMGALERQLQLDQSPASIGNPRVTGGFSRAEHQRPSALAEPSGESRARYVDGRNDRFHTMRNNATAREDLARHRPGPSYHDNTGQSPQAQRHEFDYNGFNGMGRHGQPLRRGDDHDYRPELPTEQYRYHEGGQPGSHPPVQTQTYEIVHVVEPGGEYFIRRPVQRDPEPMYAPEQEWLARRDTGYTAPGARYVASRESAPTNARRDVHPWDYQKSHGTKPTFFDEYDPRFPGA